jgi:ABC-2 type transport system ATP-binding protein
MSAVAVQGVWKSFRRWEHRSLKHLVVGGWRQPRTRVEVLRGVSLAVEPGEFVGLIGPNGSGKSTLFKLISGIFPPDQGSIHCHGRLAPLIELNAGFHPDLTGWENLFLNGAILGLSRQEIAARKDRIVEFSGVGGFMDTPTRFFSSGMLSRLAFSINVFVDAEVLLIDEVLAVGDEEFQARCLTTLRERNRNGATVIFVSHDLAAVRQEATRTVWLEQGTVLRDGPTGEVIDAYRACHQPAVAPRG